jgi:hypothetical protein
MIFSKHLRVSAAGLLIIAAPALWAKDGLGEIHSSAAAGNASPAVNTNASAPGMRRMLAQRSSYSVDEVQMADGSRVRKYLADSGQIFAVTWNTLYKPDLSLLLGTYFSSYAGAARQAAQKGGIQRQFHHETPDLVVQSSGHLHVFSGYAYLRSAFPAGVTARTLGWE